MKGGDVGSSGSTDSKTTQYKIALLGQAGVGKSNIMLRGTKNEYNKDAISTIGVQFSKKDMQTENGTKVQMIIWDTCGQEQYRNALSKIIFQNLKGVILVYEVTSKQSLEDLKYWIKIVRDNCGDDVQILIAGNKCDLPEQVVDIKEAEQLAQDYNIKSPPIEVSAQENIRINELYNQMLDLIHGGGSQKQELESPKPEPIVLKPAVQKQEKQDKSCC